MSTGLSGLVKKVGGSEEIQVTNEHYCNKFMYFNKNDKFSMHFHVTRIETWYVIYGKFTLEVIDTKTAEIKVVNLNIRDTMYIDQLIPYRLTCHEAGTIFRSKYSRKYSIIIFNRVFTGDSQINLTETNYE